MKTKSEGINFKLYNISMVGKICPEGTKDAILLLKDLKAGYEILSAISVSSTDRDMGFVQYILKLNK